MVLEVEKLYFSYNRVPMLRDVSFQVFDSEIVGIIGPNGCGKSTLIKSILCLLDPDSGRVNVDGNSVKEMSINERAASMSYVPQFITPNFSHSVFYTVLMGRKPYIGWTYSEHDRKITLDTLKQMKLDDLGTRLFNTLSGGEKQKTLLARAMAQDCRVMLLDEPTSNLDLKHKKEVMMILKKISNKKKNAVIMAIHDLNLAALFCDRLILLSQGKKVEEGSPVEVITKENLKKIYDVEVDISFHNNNPYIILVP